MRGEISGRLSMAGTGQQASDLSTLRRCRIPTTRRQWPPGQATFSALFRAAREHVRALRRVGAGGQARRFEHVYTHTTNTQVHTAFRVSYFGEKRKKEFFFLATTLSPLKIFR